MSSVFNPKHMLWLALAAMPLFTAGCPVDVNEAVPGDDDTGPPDECAEAALASVRVFHAAAGTRVLRPDFVDPSTPNLQIRNDWA